MANIGATEKWAAEHAASGGRRLALVDANRLRRDCVGAALGRASTGWRVGDFASSEEVVRRLEAGAVFDVALLAGSTCADIDLAGLAALAAAAPRLPILVAADDVDSARARAILAGGAHGFLPTSLSLETLLEALECLCGGGRYLPTILAEPIATPAAAAPPDALTRRQREVLAEICEGKSNKRIADTLRVSESTVKAHVKAIIRRLGVANRTQAALLAAGAEPATNRPAAAGPLRAAAPHG